MTTFAASSILPSPSKPRRVSCICSSPSCHTLSICFQSIDNDIRGLFMQLPSVGSQRLQGLKEFKIERTLVHFGQYSANKDEWLCTIDRRKLHEGRSGIEEGEGEVMQTRKYVANHHFHPEILQLMLQQKLTYVDCTTEEVIRELNLVGNGYTTADLYHGVVKEQMKTKLYLPGRGATSDYGPYYVPVPSYKGAQQDYQKISTKWRLNKMIQECRDNFYQWNSTLAPSGEDNILMPVEKRARGVKGVLPAMDSDNILDLQRGVCMLSDELERAQEEIKRLRCQLGLQNKLWEERNKWDERKDAREAEEREKKSPIVTTVAGTTLRSNSGENNSDQILFLSISPGRLGLTVNFNHERSEMSITNNTTHNIGAIITEIDPSCTFRHQLDIGDRIVTIDGEQVRSIEDLSRNKDRLRKFGIVKRLMVPGTCQWLQEQLERHG